MLFTLEEKKENRTEIRKKKMERGKNGMDRKEERGKRKKKERNRNRKKKDRNGNGKKSGADALGSI